jgi:lysylphosphatidylglycerol synthetase-like protein (DUF2156 family)
MDTTANGVDTGRRISLFFLGLSVAVLSGFIGWTAFALPTVDSSEGWWLGWADAHERMQEHLGMAAVVGVSIVFIVVGIGFMGWSVIGSRSRLRDGHSI